MFDVPSPQVGFNFSREKLLRLVPFIGMGVGVSGILSMLALVWLHPIQPVVEASNADICITQPFPGSVVVYVSGAVHHPGVYALSPGSRVDAAITASGNFLDQADKIYINRQLNLAETVTDGQHIYVPYTEEHSLAGNQEDQATTITTSANTAESLISINHASQSELESLPRIGTKTAEKILAGRPYTDPFELVGRKVLSQSIYDEIKGMLTL